MSDTALATNKPLCFSKQIHDEKTSAIQYKNEPAIELYVRQQGNIAFKFSVINKKLTAEAIREGKVQQLPIDGIPQEFQINLNEEKITKIKYMLEQCYFSVQGEKILIHARGLGGWNKDVHCGYDEVNGNITYKEYGTYRSARIVEFSIPEAKIIADACQMVDDDLITGPYPFLGNPPQHFDTYRNTWDNWATDNDPRIQYMNQYFNAAIRCKEIDHEQSLKYLGAGLHSLQDMFAHTPDFSVNLGNVAAQGGGADDVEQYPPDRKTQMVRATKLYLEAYKLNRTLTKHLMPTLAEFRENPPKQSTAYKAMSYIPVAIGGALGGAIGAVGGTFLAPGAGTVAVGGVGAGVGAGAGFKVSTWLKKKFF